MKSKRASIASGSANTVAQQGRQPAAAVAERSKRVQKRLPKRHKPFIVP